MRGFSGGGPVPHRARRARKQRYIAGNEELAPPGAINATIHPQSSALVQEDSVDLYRRDLYFGGGLRVRSQNDIAEPEHIARQQNPPGYETRKGLRPHRFDWHIKLPGSVVRFLRCGHGIQKQPVPRWSNWGGAETSDPLLC